MSERNDGSTYELERRDTMALIGCRLLVTAGPPEDVGRVVTFTRGTLIIGRSPTCELPLQDIRASRRHAALTLDRDGIVLRDLESRNGTFYLGSRIERAHVPHGASITIGQTTISILPLESSAPAPSAITSYSELAGESVAIRRVFTTLQQLEASDVNVHLFGETGTGKELVARIIHRKSRRSGAPFVAVDCSALRDETMNIELFGRAGRGPGAIEQADGGTVYLDDVDALPTSAQVRLLRVLERNETRRIDDNVRRRVNVRVIASTQRELSEAVQSEAMREDLRHRLAVVTLRIPPLRERPEDVPHIVNAIARSSASEHKLGATEMAQLTSRSWPGNVRELRTVVLRALALGSAGLEQPSWPAQDRTVGTSDMSYKEARERLVVAFEAKFVTDLMERHGGNVSAAAREAKISRKHLHELLRRHRIPT